MLRNCNCRGLAMYPCTPVPWSLCPPCTPDQPLSQHSTFETETYIIDCRSTRVIVADLAYLGVVVAVQAVPRISYRTSSRDSYSVRG
jgi:hypothetical protein